jgi:hypothetical protein
VETPFTVPVVEPIVATPVFSLVHIPPGVISVSVVALPTHTVPAPDIVPTGARLPLIDNPLTPVSEEKKPHPPVVVCPLA